MPPRRRLHRPGVRPDPGPGGRRASVRRRPGPLGPADRRSSPGGRQEQIEGYRCRPGTGRGPSVPPPQVRRSEGLALVEDDLGSRRLILHVGQEFELDHRTTIWTIGLPTPDPLAIGLELRVHERHLEPPRLHGATGDLKVDLHVHVGGSGVLEVAARAGKLRDEASEYDELGSASVVVDDADQRPLGGAPCSPASFRFLEHSQPPTSARPPLLPGRQRRAGPRRHVAMARHATPRPRWPAVVPPGWASAAG